MHFSGVVGYYQMARAIRIEFPGAFYHVMNRSNTGTDLFRSNRDREKFLEYIGKAVDRFGIKVHAYCLMTTHYHILIETPLSFFVAQRSK